MSGSHAYRLIDASEVVRELPEGTPAPVNEAQARELAKVPPEDRAEVMKEASQATGGKPTAAAVKAAATKREAEKRTTRRKPASKPAATKPADEEAGKEEPACGPIAEPGDIVPYWIEVGIDRISKPVKSPRILLPSSTRNSANTWIAGKNSYNNGTSYESPERSED